MSNMQKLKLFSPVVTILIVLLVSTLLLAIAGAGSTFAFVVEGEDCGLNVRAADGFTDVGKLNPGDTKSSYLMVTNTGERTFPYFFSIERIGNKRGFYRGETGEPLDEILEMTVKLGDETLFEGKIADFNKELEMGNLAPADEQQVDIIVYFPGEAGNDYQGSEVTVRFKFRAVCGAGGDDPTPPGDDDDGDDPTPPGDDDDGDDPTPPGDDDDGDDPTPPGDDDGDDPSPPGDDDLEVPPETPGGEGPNPGGKEPPETPETEEFFEPEEPAVFPPEEPATPPTELEVHPELPKTGEFSRPAIYILGLLLLLAGLVLKKRSALRNQEQHRSSD